MINLRNGIEFLNAIFISFNEISVNEVVQQHDYNNCVIRQICLLLNVTIPELRMEFENE